MAGAVNNSSILEIAQNCMASHHHWHCRYHLSISHHHLHHRLHRFIGRNLEELGLCMQPHLTDQSIVALSNQCKGLRKLELAFAYQLSSSLLHLTNLHTLTHLNLCRVSMVTNDIVCALARSCPALHTLNLRMCTHVNDIGIEALYKHCLYLRLLHIYECSSELVERFRLRDCIVVCHLI